MKIQYVANDGVPFESMKEAKLRDVCYELGGCLKRNLKNFDAEHLEDFIKDKKQVNTVIMGILKAVEEIEKIGKVEKNEIPF